MRRTFWGFGAIGVVSILGITGLTVNPAHAGWPGREGPVTDCSGLHVRFNHHDTAFKSEEKTFSRAEAPILRVNAETNGGVQVWGWDKDTYSVTACKFVEGTQSEAEQIFPQIQVNMSGGEVSATGPGRDDDRNWSVFFLIRTPKNAAVNLEATNGPLSFYTVDGKLTARVTNGPITMSGVSGEAEVEATNGPITIADGSGKLRVRTTNGPITVALRENAWNGSGLVADAENGPVTLHVPSGFQSSFLVESRGNGPVSCQASICESSRKTWDEDRKRIEYGNGTPQIQLSSVNGPVSVRQSSGS
jgi:Putative adhesin